MKKERVNIDQALCNHARILIAGGATTEMAADMLEIGQSTLQKIRRAGFDAEKYQQMKQQEKERMARAAQVETSRDKDWKRWKTPEEIAKAAEEQVPGQMQMELPEKETEEQGKQYRFLAAMVDKMCREQAAMVDDLCLKIDKLNDTLGIIYRAIRKE